MREEFIETDTSIVNEAPDFFQDGEEIRTGNFYNAPQAVINYIFEISPTTKFRGEDGHWHLVYLVDDICDLYYEDYKRSEWENPFYVRSKVWLKLKAEFIGAESQTIYRYDEDGNIVY